MPPAALMGKIMPEPVLRRRNSIASSVIPAKLNLSSNDDDKSSFHVLNGERKVLHAVDDLELLSLRLQQTNYTSLKDLLPSSPGIQSPRAVPGCAETGYEICIRNRLVKQAAWAYLQPQSVTPGSSGQHFFERIWDRFSSEYLRNSLNACLEFLDRHVVSVIRRAFDRLFGLIWFGWNRRR